MRVERWLHLINFQFVLQQSFKPGELFIEKYSRCHFVAASTGIYNRSYRISISSLFDCTKNKYSLLQKCNEFNRRNFQLTFDQSLFLQLALQR